MPEYIRRAEKLLTEEERRDIVDYLAAHPKAGDIMEGTGGVRKLRWGRQGRGKSGDVRVIYYVHSELPADHVRQKRARQSHQGGTQ